MTYVITQPCCNDAACVPVCPVNCIHPTPDEPDFRTAEQLYIDPDSCIECGACVDVCPVGAIHADYELPEGQEPFIELNALWFGQPEHQDYPLTPSRSAAVPVPDASREASLRIAVVGSGPAACYFVEECLQALGSSVHINLFERLPVIGGLVRHGIAPDHQSTKKVSQRFASTLRAANVHLFLNCEVGVDISHEDLLRHHHAVVYATGSPEGARLGVPGEDLAGSMTALEFVSWYNGHPDHADLSIGLGHERVVVVGNGNVALDVARILTASVDDLRRTDIADHALEALALSRVKEVVVLGRRGPADAAFSAGELIGIAARSSVPIVGVDDDVLVDDAELSHSARIKMRLLADLPRGTASEHQRRIVLRFGASPVAITGTEAVDGVALARHEARRAGGVATWRATGVVEDVSCGLVISCIGYRGSTQSGLPFDSHRGVIANEASRVITAVGADARPGQYVVGWAKRGPSGGVGLNRSCARETLQAVIEDHASGALRATTQDQDSLLESLSATTVVDRAGWLAIDAVEKAAGREQGRPRVKMVSKVDMVTNAAAYDAT